MTTIDWEYRMAQINILENEDLLTLVLTTNDIRPYDISVVSHMWHRNSKDYVEVKKQRYDLYKTFWLLRSYARSFYDMDFMPI